MDTLKNLVFLETEQEKIKQSLALKADFNLYDAFKVFDKKNIGELTIIDIEYGF